VNKGFKIVAGAAAVIILLVFAIACGGGGTTTKTYNMKEQFSVGKGAWKVLSVQITKDLQRKEGTGKFTAEGTFVVLQLSLTNNGNENANLTGDEVELMDDARNSYAFDSKNNNVYLDAVGKPSFTRAAVEPGKTTTGYLIFDVSSDAKGLKAKVKDIDIRGTGFAYVNLNN
jgi:hypothetical protein